MAIIQLAFRCTVVAITFLSFSTHSVAQNPPGPAIVLANVQLDESRLRVHFIDIGPGLAMLIETPGGRHFFVDGGKWGLADMETYVRHFVPTDTPIDATIVTHADLDHYKGMLRIFDTYQVREFWYTGYQSQKLSTRTTWSALLEVVDDEEDCVQYLPINVWVSAGDTEVLDDNGTTSTQDDVVVRYLNVDQSPPAVDPVFGRSFSESEQRNNASLVIKITYRDISFLITGDINGRDKDHSGTVHDNEIDSEELELWTRHSLDPARYSLSATVLQAPHHGSNGSSSLPFLNAVNPDWVVITAGHQFNHPHPDTLRRIGLSGIPDSHVLRTDDGDSTPETSAIRDPRGDDSFIFETDGQTMDIIRVKMQ